MMAAPTAGNLFDVMEVFSFCAASVGGMTALWASAILPKSIRYPATFQRF
jgi:hypothetical protein